MSPALDHRGIAALIDWLIDGCRSAPESDAVMTQLCERLFAAGVPLSRAAIFIRTLHPEIMGRRFLWRPGAPAEISQAGYETYQHPDFLGSPVVRVYETGNGLRRRLADPDCPIDFPILNDFRRDGITDYLVSPLRFSNGEIHVATWTTQAPGGFSDPAVAALESVANPLSRIAEVRGLRRVAVNLLDTYVGGNAGAKIMGGKIRRGDIETIRAAIWLSDMRDFTGRADRMAPRALIDLLNRYFDCQVPAIRERGGEVLKFMGDGLLAIFPIETEGAVELVCRNVLGAARKARADVAAADWSGIDAGKGGGGAMEAPGFGLALHLGEVLYGNIGSGNRLDFTCIGPAINLTARIEKLTASTGQTILASADFAQACAAEVQSGALMPIGEFALKGIEAKQAVFGLG